MDSVGNEPSECESHRNQDGKGYQSAQPEGEKLAFAFYDKSVRTSCLSHFPPQKKTEKTVSRVLADFGKSEIHNHLS